jgi:hypothetical protein
MGGQGARVSEPPATQPLSQSIAIMRAAGGGVEHLAVNGIVSLSAMEPFGDAPGDDMIATHREMKRRAAEAALL